MQQTCSSTKKEELKVSSKNARQKVANLGRIICMGHAADLHQGRKEEELKVRSKNARQKRRSPLSVASYAWDMQQTCSKTKKG